MQFFIVFFVGLLSLTVSEALVGWNRVNFFAPTRPRSSSGYEEVEDVAGWFWWPSDPFQRPGGETPRTHPRTRQLADEKQAAAADPPFS